MAERLGQGAQGDRHTLADMPVFSQLLQLHAAHAYAGIRRMCCVVLCGKMRAHLI